MDDGYLGPMPVTVFGVDGPGQSSPGQLECTPASLVLQLKDGNPRSIPYSSVRAEVDASELGNLVLRIDGEPEGELLVYSDRWSDVMARVALAPTPFRRRVEELSRQRSIGQRRASGRLLGMGVAVVLVATVGYLLLGLAADRIVDRIPPSVEAQLGRAAAATYGSQETRFDDATVRAAVDSIARRLTDSLSNSPYQYEFHVVADAQVNAFALPGGQVVILTGLLAAAETPEEVAGVLAHEITHVEHRHSLRKLVRSMGLAVTLQLLTGDPGAMSTLLERYAARLLGLQFDRSQEADADTGGFALLKRARIAPTGMADFFQRLAKREGALRHATQFLATHPLSQQRAETIRRLAEETPGDVPEPFDIDWAEVRQRSKSATP